MLRRLSFPAAVFAVTVCWMALQKPVFLLFYHARAFQASAADWWAVVRHGLWLDSTVAGYVAALPALAVLASWWMPASWGRTMRRLLRCWLILAAVATAAIFAVDLGLYGYWGFRLDGSVLIYLATPSEALASVTWGEALRQLAIFALYAAAMIASYLPLVRLFGTGGGPSLRGRAGGSLLALALCGALFVAIRGGFTVAVANVSKVYFSKDMFLNHAAVNPVFSFLSSVGERREYAEAYPFFSEERRRELFDGLRGNRSGADDGTPSLLCTQRPDVVLVLLESFGRTIVDDTVGGRPVMPNMQRLRREGVWFENFFANSYRTDRGEVAVLCGFPAQTTMSIMKLPRKNASLPSLARSLGREGYRSLFVYGGDLNFTDQASFMYATGWERLLWQKQMRLDAPTSKWGYADDVVADLFADEVEALSRAEEPFLAGWLTLSSHEPFDVPFAAFDDRLLNAMAFTDAQIGRLIDRLKASPAWENLLVVLVADHAYPYPEGLSYNEPLRHRIPMLWLGGAVARPAEVDTYASQIDLCATLLAQLCISHEEFDYSKNIFGSEPPHRFGYWCFSDGFGFIDAEGEAVYDHTSGRVVRSSGAGCQERLDRGKALLQTTYEDIGRR